LGSNECNVGSRNRHVAGCGSDVGSWNREVGGRDGEVGGRDRDVVCCGSDVGGWNCKVGGRDHNVAGCGSEVGGWSRGVGGWCRSLSGRCRSVGGWDSNVRRLGGSGSFRGRPEWQLGGVGTSAGATRVAAGSATDHRRGDEDGSWEGWDRCGGDRGGS
jgi:hypothetical protein